jgi:hypothetical protein
MKPTQLVRAFKPTGLPESFRHSTAGSNSRSLFLVNNNNDCLLGFWAVGTDARVKIMRVYAMCSRMALSIGGHNSSMSNHYLASICEFTRVYLSHSPGPEPHKSRRTDD